MSLPTLTGVGRLVADPELRFTSSGKAVCRLRVAFSDRKKDQATGEWRDGDKIFLDVTVWEQEAENIAESLTRGTELVVSGKLRQREFEDREGNKRTSYELVFPVLGPTLKYATAKVTKAGRNGAGGGGGRGSDYVNTAGVDGSFGDEAPW